MANNGGSVQLLFRNILSSSLPSYSSSEQDIQETGEVIDDSDNEQGEIAVVSSKGTDDIIERYRIGSCSTSAEVYWRFTDNLQDAERIFSRETKRNSSAVLFDERKRVPLLFSSVHGADVACILAAFQESSNRDPTVTCTTIDRSLVEDAVACGDAPFVPPSRPKTKQWLLKGIMETLFWRETVHFFSAAPYRYSSLCFYDVNAHPNVRGHVALTFDDAPCRFSRDNSRLEHVLELLADFGCTATFMMVGKFMKDKSHQQDLVNIFQQGHEMGNHGMMDRAYDSDSPENFAKEVDECNEQIHEIQRLAGVPQIVRYFRAPHAKYTRSMEEVIHSRGLVNVMCDTYASCPIVEDGHYIGSCLSQRAQHGSIILLHMPELGFRDWCMVALRRLLLGIQERNLKLVSVSELEKLAAM